MFFSKTNGFYEISFTGDIELSENTLKTRSSMESGETSNTYVKK